jgi:DNA gyrase/topoisomerase IV subunit A
VPLDGDFKFKEGDGPAFALHCQTTDKLLIAADNGRFYTLGADKLPGARGFGEPIRTMLDIDAAPGLAKCRGHLASRVEQRRVRLKRRYDTTSDGRVRENVGADPAHAA